MRDHDGASLAHLLGRLAVLEAQVRGAVERRRVDDPVPDDPFRGLYLSDQDVTRLLGQAIPGPAPDPEAVALLGRVEGEADAAEQAGATPSRLRRLGRSFCLSPVAARSSAGYPRSTVALNGVSLLSATRASASLKWRLVKY